MTPITPVPDDPAAHTDAVPSLGEALATDGRRLADGTLLQASLTASLWLGAAWISRETPDADSDRELVDQAITATSQPGGWTALFALASVISPDLRNLVSDELEKCPPLERPNWAQLAYEAPQPVEVREVSDALGDEQLYVLHYDHPEPHDLVVSLTHDGGTIVRSIEVLEAAEIDLSTMGGTGTGDRLDAHMSTPDPDTALGELALAIAQTDRYWPPFDDPDYVQLRALLRHRVAGHQPTEPSALSDAEWDGLVDEFVREAHAAGSELDDETLQISAGSLLEFGVEHLAGGALAWTPSNVRHYLLEWTPDDELVSEDEAAELPTLLRVWLQMIARRRDLSREQTDDLVAEVEKAEPEYLDWYATAFSDDTSAEDAALDRLFSERPGHDPFPDA